MQTNVSCLTKINEYHGNHYCRSTLAGEDKSGKQLDILNGLTLTVDQSGYKLTNSDEAIIRQGLITDVFEIYDSTKLDLRNLTVIDDINGERTDFESYEKRYGHGRVERTKSRRFFAYTETTETETAIGICEVKNDKTLAIYSLYYGDPLSRREKAAAIAAYIEPMLSPTERGSITAVGVTPDRANIQYSGVLRVYNDGYRAKHEQARLLFEQAKERQESVSEVFEGAGIEYEIQHIYETDVSET